MPLRGEAIERGEFESLGPDNAAAVESGLQKLAEDRSQEITPSEMFGLEAIVLPRNRPVVFVRGESYDDLEEPDRPPRALGFEGGSE